MQTRILCTAAALALAVAACSKNNAETNNIAATDNMAMDNNMSAEANNTTAIAAPSATDFANQIAASDRFEIESGNLAAKQGTSPAIKDFGQMLVTAHTQSTADLKAAGASSNPPITPSDALDAEKEGMLAKLKSATGADFDQQFIEQQIAGHQKALDLLNAYAAGGDNAALKAFATKATPIVQSHLDKARALKK